MSVPEIVDPEKNGLFLSILANLGEQDGRPIPPAVVELAEAVGADPRTWWKNCHGASLTIVRARLINGARVARGHATMVGLGQHSWIVVGDPYRPERIIDPTRWSYEEGFMDAEIPSEQFKLYRPHGAGHFMTAGMPFNHGDREVRLIVNRPMSHEARNFLAMLGPLDIHGWMQVAHLPVEGWPAGEIFGYMDDTPKLATLVPIDRLGMLTDRNPGGLYLPDKSGDLDD